MADTVQALQRFKQAFDDFDLCLSRLGAHESRSILVGEWSAADFAAHFAGHQYRLTQTVTKLIDDFDAGDLDEARTEDDDNAAWIRQFEGLTREQVQSELEEAFTNCHAAVEAVVSERQEAASMISGWLEREAAHYRSHTFELRSALMDRLAATPGP